MTGSAPPREPGTPAPNPERIRELVAFCDRAAWWLDDCARIPGTPFRLGLDAAIGLVPVAGDLLGFAVSGVTIARAAQAGVPRALLLKMARNVAIDLLGSFVPVLGDAFDTVFKAHRRNFTLLRTHYAAQLPGAAAPRARSRVAAVVTAVVLAAIAYGIARLL